MFANKMFILFWRPIQVGVCHACVNKQNKEKGVTNGETSRSGAHKKKREKARVKLSYSSFGSTFRLRVNGVLCSILHWSTLEARFTDHSGALLRSPHLRLLGRE